jgi:hypothetical protein
VDTFGLTLKLATPKVGSPRQRVRLFGFSHSGSQVNCLVQHP